MQILFEQQFESLISLSFFFFLASVYRARFASSHIFIVKLPLYKHPGQDRSRPHREDRKHASLLV